MEAPQIGAEIYSRPIPIDWHIGCLRRIKASHMLLIKDFGGLMVSSLAG
jgi:hypothetical protein